jgi:hypothetical protein
LEREKKKEKAKKYKWFPTLLDGVVDEPRSKFRLIHAALLDGLASYQIRTRCTCDHLLESGEKIPENSRAA